MRFSARAATQSLYILMMKAPLEQFQDRSAENVCLKLVRVPRGDPLGYKLVESLKGRSDLT